MKMDGKLTNMALKLDAMDKGVKTGFVCVDKNLEALDAHVNHPRKDYNDVVRTDLANRPTEPMLVSFETQYTKL